MSVVTLKLQPLTAEAFAPFGDVIEISDNNEVISINYGLTERHHDLAKVDVDNAGGKAVISIFNTKPVHLPFRVKVMERHPLGSQAFMPLSGNPYLVVVAPAGEFDPGMLRAFIAHANQGVNYYKGIWHHYCLGMNKQNQFLVVDRGGEDRNCDEAELASEHEYIVNY